MEPSIYRLRQQDLLAFCVLALLCLGVIMVQSAAMNVAGETGWRWNPLGVKQFGFCFVGLAAFLIVGHLDYTWLAGKYEDRGSRIEDGKGALTPSSILHPPSSSSASLSSLRHPVAWLLALTIVLNLLVLIPGVGISKNGARRWLPLGITQLQPSEVAKWAVVIFLAWWLTRRDLDLGKFFKGFVPTLIPIGLICLLIVIQDFGTAALIAICALVMLLAARIKWWHLALVIPPALAAGAWFILHKEYRWKRMTAFLDPWASPQHEGYHMIQSLLSFSTGGVTGKGLGNGIQKLGYLPEDTTDFIFAVICEELGLFGALLPVALYLGILYVAWQVIKDKTRDDFGRMLAFGVGSMIGLQATINIAVATVSVPTKGLSLPLVSAGGSGLVITCAALGLLYSITRCRPAVESAMTPFELITPEPPGTEPSIG